MPLYDCGDPNCFSCQEEFGPDRRAAIARYVQRCAEYAATAATGLPHAPIDVAPRGPGYAAPTGSVRCYLRADGTQHLEFWDRNGILEAEIECANNRIAACVQDVEDRNIPDARWVAEVLNRFGHLVPHPGNVP